MAALFSFRNDALGASLASGTTVAAGSLENLRARQLERGVVLTGGSAPGWSPIGYPEPWPDSYGGSGKWLSVPVPEPTWSIPPAEPYNIYVNRRGVRVIALLGLDLPVYANVPTDNGRIEVFGWRLNGAYANTYTYIGSMSAYRDLATDGESGLCNRILCLPSAGDGLLYSRYEIRLNVVKNGAQTNVRLGGIWIGNAVELGKGVDADWQWGVQDAGRIAVSRGGQAYATPAPPLRTVRATLSGNGLDARLAFGKGITIPGTGIHRASDWLSDAATHLGTTGSCILVPRASDDFWVRQTGIYGRLNNSPLRIEHLAGDYFRSSFEVIEER